MGSADGVWKRLHLSRVQLGDKGGGTEKNRRQKGRSFLGREMHMGLEALEPPQRKVGCIRLTWWTVESGCWCPTRVGSETLGACAFFSGWGAGLADLEFGSRTKKVPDVWKMFTYLKINKSFVLWAGQYSKHFTNSNYFNSHNAHWAKYYYYSVLRVRKQGRKQLAPVETVSERLSEDSGPTRAPESMLLAPASCSCLSLSLWGAVWLCRQFLNNDISLKGLAAAAESRSRQSL